MHIKTAKYYAYSMVAFVASCFAVIALILALFSVSMVSVIISAVFNFMAMATAETLEDDIRAAVEREEL